MQRIALHDSTLNCNTLPSTTTALHLLHLTAVLRFIPSNWQSAFLWLRGFWCSLKNPCGRTMPWQENFLWLCRTVHTFYAQFKILPLETASCTSNVHRAAIHRIRFEIITYYIYIHIDKHWFSFGFPGWALWSSHPGHGTVLNCIPHSSHVASDSNSSNGIEWMKMDEVYTMLLPNELPNSWHKDRIFNFSGLRDPISAYSWQLHEIVNWYSISFGFLKTDPCCTHARCWIGKQLIQARLRQIPSSIRENEPSWSHVCPGQDPTYIMNRRM